MQDFDFPIILPKLAQILGKFIKLWKNLNLPKFTRICPNLLKFYPNLPKIAKKNFARGCGRIPCISSSYGAASGKLASN